MIDFDVKGGKASFDQDPHLIYFFCYVTEALITEGCLFVHIVIQIRGGLSRFWKRFLTPAGSVCARMQACGRWEGNRGRIARIFFALTWMFCSWAMDEPSRRRTASSVSLGEEKAGPNAKALHSPVCPCSILHLRIRDTNHESDAWYKQLKQVSFVGMAGI